MNLTLATENIIIRFCFGIRIWRWRTVDLVVQMTLLILNTLIFFNHLI